MIRSNVAYIFVLGALLSACGQDIVPYSAPEEIQPLVADIAARINQAGGTATLDNLTIRYSNELDAKTLGACISSSDPDYVGGEILINSERYLSKLDTAQRYPSDINYIGLDGKEYPLTVAYIIAHEMGHCILKKKHEDGLMYPTDQSNKLIFNGMTEEERADSFEDLIDYMVNKKAAKLLKLKTRSLIASIAFSAPSIPADADDGEEVMDSNE